MEHAVAFLRFIDLSEVIRRYIAREKEKHARIILQDILEDEQTKGLQAPADEERR